MSLLSKAQRATINGVVYDITPHPATQGLKLVRLIGSHLSDLKIDLQKDEKGDVNFNLIDLVKLATAFCEYSLTHDPEFNLIKDMLRHTIITLDNKSRSVMDVFDDHYASNWGELFEVMAEVIKVNNFLPMLQGFGSQAVSPSTTTAPMGQ